MSLHAPAMISPLPLRLVLSLLRSPLDKPLMVLDSSCGKSLSHMARKQKLFQSFSGINQICANFPNTWDKDDFEPLKVHRQLANDKQYKQKEIDIQRAFDLFYGCPTTFCVYTVAYLCQETGKEDWELIERKIGNFSRRGGSFLWEAGRWC